MTEEDAKTKICPILSVAGTFVVGFDEDKAKCKASDCAMWTITDKYEKHQVGYGKDGCCGLTK